MKVKLVPELDVTEMSASLNFYVTVCGFTIRYERPEERFAYLESFFQDLGSRQRHSELS